MSSEAGLAFSAAALLTCVACGIADVRAPAHSIRDSSGITIVENPARAPDSASLTVDSVPLAVMGAANEGDNYTFTRIFDAVLLEGGRIAVVDQGQPVRIFDSAGKFVRHLGRIGLGPGEYRQPMHLSVLRGDTLAVHSVYSGTDAVLFAPDGSWLRSIRPSVLSVPGAEPGTYSSPSLSAVLPDGSVHGVARRVETNAPRDAAPARAILETPLMRHFRTTEDGTLLDDYGELPGSQRWYYPPPDPRGGGGAIFNNPAIVPHSFVSILADGIAHVDGAFSEVRVWSGARKLRRIVRRNVEASAPDRVWADSIWTQFATLMIEQGQLHWLRGAAPPPIEPRPPEIDAMLVDDRSNLWLRRSPVRQKPQWFVFDSTGVLRHSLRLHGEVHDIRDQRIVMVQRDSMFTPSIVVYRLNRPGG